MVYRRLQPSSFYAPQAERGPEESFSLVTLARRSQPGRKGPVNSRILETLNRLHDEIRELTGPFRSGSLVVGRVARENVSDHR